uniref:Uncharacterized protein n=1 Tax=Oryza glaberrima TaxID=4538 RepID=I1Q1A1_ORYGL
SVGGWGRAAGDKPAAVEDVVPITMGLERKELAAELKVHDGGGSGRRRCGRWASYCLDPAAAGLLPPGSGGSGPPLAQIRRW